MKILIAEEALQTGSGHWPSYVGDIATYCRSQGDDVHVLTHRDAVPELIENIGGTPCYSYNCWKQGARKNGFSVLSQCRSYMRETLEYIRKEGPFDVVLAPTMRIHQLLAYAVLTRFRSIPAKTRFVLLFVQGFGRYAGRGKVTSFPTGFSTCVARFAFGRLAKQVRAGRVVLAGETAKMCDELTRFTGLAASLFPHPVQLSTTQAPKSLKSRPSGDSPVLTIGCPGHARYEKGSDLFHDAILALIENGEVNSFHFILQWPHPIGMPDQTEKTPDSRLLNHQSVEFINENLDSEQYHDLLSRCDLVILPYRSAAYQKRLSRVAIEAAIRSIPLIFTCHTWTQEIVDLVGTGVSMEGESADAVVEALHRAMTDFSSLKQAADEGADQVRLFHSAQSFRSHLMLKQK